MFEDGVGKKVFLREKSEILDVRLTQEGNFATMEEDEDVSGCCLSNLS